MIAQTNLQLYRQCIDLGWTVKELARLRAGYELASRLVSGMYRPSGKPFVCHLVGVASALLMWRQPPEVVLAGLVHSGYLYGTFDDDAQGVTPARRRCLREAIGPEAEQHVYEYSAARGKSIEAVTNPIVRLMYLADVRDEIADCGVAFAASKSITSGQTKQSKIDEQVIRFAEATLGDEHAAEFRTTLDASIAQNVPQPLASNRRASIYIRPGVDALRPTKWQRKLRRLKQKLTLRRAG